MGNWKKVVVYIFAFLYLVGTAPQVQAQSGAVLPVCPQQGDGSQDFRTLIGVGDQMALFGRIYNNGAGNACTVPTSFRVVYTAPLNPSSTSATGGSAYWDVRSASEPNTTQRIVPCTQNGLRDFTCPAIDLETGVGVLQFWVTADESGISQATVWQGLIQIHKSDVRVWHINYLPQIGAGGVPSTN